MRARRDSFAPDLLVRRDSLDGAQVDDFQPGSVREASNIPEGYISVSSCLLWAAILGIRRESAINDACRTRPGPDYRIPFRAGDRRPIIPEIRCLVTPIDPEPPDSFPDTGRPTRLKPTLN
jgi:hypothetical protein